MSAADGFIVFGPLLVIVSIMIAMAIYVYRNAVDE